ncbi:MAG: hypothetical protein PQJ59_12020 [Spirochaetales bacterium]|nr:hypothetical protein [Spirochaetales bacterium]
MKVKKRQLFFGLGGIALLLVALFIGFGGAEKGGEQNNNTRGYWVFHKLLKKGGFDLKGYRNESVFEIGAPEPEVIIVRDGENFSYSNWEKALAWNGETGGILVLSGIPRGEEFSGMFEDIPRGQSRYYKKGVLIISDDSLLQNRGILEGDNAVRVHRFFLPYRGMSFYYFRESGDKPYLGMQVLSRGPLGLVLFQVLLFVLLWGWYSAIRVGPPDLVHEKGRREMGEHLIGVGRFYSRTGHWALLDRMDRQFFLSRVKKLLTSKKGKPLRVRLSEFSDPVTVALALSEGKDEKGWKEAMKSREIILEEIEKSHRRV